MGKAEKNQMERARRAARVARIVERLQRLDDGTLEVIDRMSAEAISSLGSPGPQRVDRRRFLGAALGGGAVAVVTGGLAVWQLRMNTTHISALEAEVSILRQVVTRYEEMEATGLDEQVEQGLSAIEPLVEGLQSLATSLSAAIADARAALLDLQSRFPTLRTGFQWLNGNITTLSQRLLGLENEVNQALDSSGTLDETMGDFVQFVQERLPATTAERVHGGLERMGEVVTVALSIAAGIGSRILEPMADWFSHSDTAGLNGWIINPLLDTVLDPAQSLVDRVEELTAAWQERLSGPAEESLALRRELRAEIARLSQRGNGP